MIKSPSHPIGRLAMRHEGTDWNAYYALNDTMDGAVPLGSIKIRFVVNPVRKAAFLDFMREAVADLIEEQTGQRPTWPDGPKAAPERERAGHA